MEAEGAGEAKRLPIHIYKLRLGQSGIHSFVQPIPLPDVLPHRAQLAFGGGDLVSEGEDLLQANTHATTSEYESIAAADRYLEWTEIVPPRSPHIAASVPRSSSASRQGPAWSWGRPVATWASTCLPPWLCLLPWPWPCQAERGLRTRRRCCCCCSILRLPLR